MRLLLDEMYSGLKDYLEVARWEAETVQEANLQGADDRSIAEYAKKHDLILITEDKKVSDLASLLEARSVHIDSKIKVRMILNALREAYPDLSW